MEHGYVVDTFTCENGDIVQETSYVSCGVKETIMRNVLSTQDAQIRESLIALGWTPPNDKKLNTLAKM